MRRPLFKVMRNNRGLAGIEFALIAPILLLLLGGLTDFALAFWSKKVLADSVAQGAQYASLAGSGVLASAVQGIVRQKLSLPTANVTVTGPSCYCVSGTPATTAVQTCGTSCPNGATPGTYMTISAQYTYTPFLPFYSGLANPVLTEAAMVRLQ